MVGKGLQTEEQRGRKKHFLSETMQVRKQWQMFKVWEDKNCLSKSLYPVKISFKNRDGIVLHIYNIRKNSYMAEFHDKEALLL